MSKQLPLKNVQVVSTRPFGRSSGLRVLVEEHGGRLLERPIIQTLPRMDAETEESINGLISKTVIVTSANAIRSIRLLSESTGVQWPLQGTTWYCISHSTAKVASENGISPIVFEHVKTGQEFAIALAPHLRNKASHQIVFLRGQKADSALVHGLESFGIQIEQRIVYDTVDVQIDVAELRTLNKSNTVVYALFSPSAVESLLIQWPDFNQCRTNRTFVVTIGETTAAACRSCQIHVDGVANRPTEIDLANKIQEVVISVHTMFDS